jgi:hypothetical protein
MCGSLSRSTITKTLPEIGPNDGLGEGEGDGDGDGEGAIGEGGFGETAIGDASSGEGEGESAAGEGESATGEGLGEMVAVAAGTRPQPAMSRRAATAMPARRCIPFILVLSNVTGFVRLRAGPGNLDAILDV